MYQFGPKRFETSLVVGAVLTNNPTHIYEEGFDDEEHSDLALQAIVLANLHRIEGELSEGLSSHGDLEGGLTAGCVIVEFYELTTNSTESDILAWRDDAKQNYPGIIGFNRRRRSLKSDDYNEKNGSCVTQGHIFLFKIHEVFFLVAYFCVLLLCFLFLFRLMLWADDP